MRCCDRMIVVGDVLPEIFGETNPFAVRFSPCIANECMFKPGFTSVRIISSY